MISETWGWRQVLARVWQGSLLKQVCCWKSALIAAQNEIWVARIRAESFEASLNEEYSLDCRLIDSANQIRATAIANPIIERQFTSFWQGAQCLTIKCACQSNEHYLDQLRSDLLWSEAWCSRCIALSAWQFQLWWLSYCYTLWQPVFQVFKFRPSCLADSLAASG